MKNKTLKYSDLSKKQIQYLKEQYIQNKVESMSHQDLKFVHEIISHQINDTIGKEEEMEAWIEMSSFMEINLTLKSNKLKKNLLATKTHKISKKIQGI